MTRAEGRPAVPTLHDSLREYGRGIAGGLLFSIPLLYTMELWEGGLTVPPARQLLLILVTFLLLLGYNRFAGLHDDTSWTEVVIDSVEELGIGVLVSAGVLFLLGQVTQDQQLHENLGMVVVEAMVVAIGVSVGTAQLGGQPLDDEGEKRQKRSSKGNHDPRELPGFAGEIVIALCGAVLFAATVAPTEEIQIIAATTSPVRLLAMVVASLLMGGGILFYSNFLGTAHRRHLVDWRDALRGSVTAYAIALVVSALFLWYFGRFAGERPPSVAAQLVVLGLPAVLGASAGKLLLQTGQSQK